jgi:dTDP-4-amino-4,6-dideoxygalactose transaminase
MTLIPFNRPSLAGKEQEYILAALGYWHVSGDGEFTRRCHALLEHHLPGARALLTTSCTHALEMAAILLDIGPGDEVIVPSFTFVSTANAFALRGATPVFADIRRDTINIDERAVDALMTSRTRAVVAVHYAGVGCEMDALCRLSSERGVALIEDNAHGLFGRYRGRPLGTFGQMSTLSFHETKNISCGEGGALIINDAALFERAEIVREKGTNRSRFFRNEVDKYTWIDIGSSYLPSDILAAYLCAQLEQWEAIQHRRRALWHGYATRLAEWAAGAGVGLPAVPAHCEPPFHLFHLTMPSEPARRSLIAHLAGRDIHALSHYVPLHTSPMGQRFGGRPGMCPVTEDISARLLRLPLFADLSEPELDRIVAAIHEWRP